MPSTKLHMNLPKTSATKAALIEYAGHADDRIGTGEGCVQRSRSYTSVCIRRAPGTIFSPRRRAGITRQYVAVVTGQRQLLHNVLADKSTCSN